MVSDNSLYTRWREKTDYDAFGDLVTRHLGMTYATCRRILEDEVAAIEVTRECFEALRTLEGEIEAPPGCWLHTEAARRSLARLDGEARRQALQQKLDERANAGAPVDWETVRPHADEAVEALPETFRYPMVYRLLEGYDDEKIADNLGVPKTTVEYRVDGGLERLQMALEKRGMMTTAERLDALFRDNAIEAAPRDLVISMRKQLQELQTAPPQPEPARDQEIEKTRSAPIMLMLMGAALVALAGIFIILRPQREAEVETPPADLEASGAPVLAPETGPGQPVSPRAVARGDQPVELPRREQRGQQRGGAASLPGPPPGQTLIGGVVRGLTSGKPLAGATVAVATPDEPMAARVSADAQGAYRLTLREPGRYTLYAAWANLPRDNELLASHIREHGVDITAEPGAVVEHELTLPDPVTASARVVDSADAPIADAQVEVITYIGETGRPFLPPGGKTDAEGRFTWDGFAPGLDFAFTIRARDRLDTTTPPMSGRPGETLPELIVELLGKGGIEGTLLDPDGHPLPRMRLVITALLGEEEHVFNATTNSEGVFTVKDGAPATDIDLIVALKVGPGDEEPIELDWGGRRLFVEPGEITSLGEIIVPWDLIPQTAAPGLPQEEAPAAEGVVE